MAVLVEAISVILKSTSVDAKVPGGWEGFRRAVPFATVCADGELVRVGFLDPRHVASFVESLATVGMRHRDDSGAADDFVVVDQDRGPTTPCAWIDMARVPWQGDPKRRVLAARRKGSTGTTITVPDGWTWSTSYTAAAARPKS
jgi:hypothetical protein